MTEREQNAITQQALNDIGLPLFVNPCAVVGRHHKGGDAVLLGDAVKPRCSTTRALIEKA